MCKISFVPCRISFCLNWAQEFSTETCSHPNDCKPTYHPIDSYVGFEYCARCQHALQATAPRPRYPGIPHDTDRSEELGIETTQDDKQPEAQSTRGFSPSSNPDIATGRECEFFYPPTAEERAYDDSVRKADRARHIDDEERYRVMLDLETPLPTPPPTPEPRKVYKPYRPVSLRPPSPTPGKPDQRLAYKRPAYVRPVYQRPVENEGSGWETDSSLGTWETESKSSEGTQLRGGGSTDSLVELYKTDSEDSLLELYLCR